jgi:DNA-binding transcriptional ArsR family regulator
LVNLNITDVDPSQNLKEVCVAAKRKFTRIPKVQDLMLAGVPTEAIPTYCALSDYTNNKTGICWPKMETLASTLGRSVRTVQRHLHQLQDLGLVEFVERRRWRGRYSSYTYRVLHVVELIRRKKKASSTTGHGVPLERGGPIFTRTKGTKTPPYNPPSEAYNSLLGKERNLEAEERHKREEQERRSEAARRRSEGYEWLFEGNG